MLIALGFVAAITALVFTIKKASGGGEARPAAPPKPLGAAELAEINRLADAGRTIEAIKRYREAACVDLTTAKNAFEALRRGPPPAPQPTDDDVKALAKDGKTVEAIQLYRRLYGVDLKDAKAAIQRFLARP